MTCEMSMPIFFPIWEKISDGSRSGLSVSVCLSPLSLSYLQNI